MPLKPSPYTFHERVRNECFNNSELCRVAEKQRACVVLLAALKVRLPIDVGMFLLQEILSALFLSVGFGFQFLVSLDKIDRCPLRDFHLPTVHLGWFQSVTPRHEVSSR